MQFLGFTSMIKLRTTIAGCMVAVFLCAGSNVALAETQYSRLEHNKHFSSVLEEGPQHLSQDFDTGISAPTSNESVQTVSELNTLKFLKAKRTDDVLEKIKFEDEGPYSVADAFEKEGLFDPKSKVKTKALFDSVNDDLLYLILRDKKKFARVRPFVLDKDIDPVIEIENPEAVSYPSGHAAQSFFMAYTLGKLNPSKADVYEEFSRDLAHRREIAGIHYPSDSEAGFRLAKNVFNGLMQNAEVKTLYDEAQTEFQIN